MTLRHKEYKTVIHTRVRAHTRMHAHAHTRKTNAQTNKRIRALLNAIVDRYTFLRIIFKYNFLSQLTKGIF